MLVFYRTVSTSLLFGRLGLSDTLGRRKKRALPVVDTIYNNRTKTDPHVLQNTGWLRKVRETLWNKSNLFIEQDLQKPPKPLGGWFFEDPRLCSCGWLLVYFQRRSTSTCSKASRPSVLDLSFGRLGFRFDKRKVAKYQHIQATSKECLYMYKQKPPRNTPWMLLVCRIPLVFFYFLVLLCMWSSF